MSQLDLFTEPDPCPARGMFRPTDLEPAKDAAVQSLSTVQSNRLLILQLLMKHEALTMFDPFVLMDFDPRFKQTAIGPRFKRLRGEELIRQVASRQPLVGAESKNVVSAFVITTKGVDYLKSQLPAGGGET